MPNPVRIAEKVVSLSTFIDVGVSLWETVFSSTLGEDAG
jgi:hypothetical protein